MTIGLHRPFNMPLKSLVWVCRFCRANRGGAPSTSPSCVPAVASEQSSITTSSGTVRDLYIDFFMWMLKAVVQHECECNEQETLGVVKAGNARRLLEMLEGEAYEDVRKRVRRTLKKRECEEDRLIYNNYKNTSYYITLAKNVELIDGRGALSPLGEVLARVRDYRFFELSDKHRVLIFRALSREFFDKLIIITQGHRLVKGDKTLEDAFFRSFLKRNGSEGLIRYITSFNDNYLEVLRHWVATLRLCTGAGTVRRMYLEEIARLGLKADYETLMAKTEAFFEDEFKLRVKEEEQYQKIRDSYEYYQKRGLTDLGYVNLYDIKKRFRLSFETYNKLLNRYYTQNRKKEIILFSNTVASIDQRRRFVVGGTAALKIRIIKKS